MVDIFCKKHIYRDNYFIMKVFYCILISIIDSKEIQINLRENPCYYFYTSIKKFLVRFSLASIPATETVSLLDCINFLALSFQGEVKHQS